MKKLFKNIGVCRIYYPQRRTINVDGKYYNLPFPHVFFSVEHHNMLYYLRMGFTNRNKKIILAPFLPNVSKFLVCLGIGSITKPNLDYLINEFWQTSFRKQDFLNNVNQILYRNSVTSFKDWEKLSLKDIQAIVSNRIRNRKYYPSSCSDAMHY